MNIIVTGSIAFDYLMSFPGKFTEHFLPEHMHRVSLSFLVDTMDKRRGGCAPNIAYTLALLGERPLPDGDGRRGLRRVPRSGSRRPASTRRSCSRSPASSRASFFCSTDQANNQIASFYTGRDGGRRRAVVPHGRATAAWRSSRRTIPAAMVQYAEECRTLGIPFIFDPGQQCARMSGDELRDGITGAHHRHLQRLRVRAAPAEDRARRGGHPRRTRRR